MTRRGFSARKTDWQQRTSHLGSRTPPRLIVHSTRHSSRSGPSFAAALTSTSRTQLACSESRSARPRLSGWTKRLSRWSWARKRKTSCRLRQKCPNRIRSVNRPIPLCSLMRVSLLLAARLKVSLKKAAPSLQCLQVSSSHKKVPEKSRQVPAPPNQWRLKGTKTVSSPPTWCSIQKRRSTLSRSRSRLTRQGVKSRLKSWTKWSNKRSRDPSNDPKHSEPSANPN